MKLENNQALTNYITTYHSQLDNIYIDKFWSSINNKEWIYADDVLIEWIGFNVSTGKAKYLKLIKENFKENDDYKTYDYEEINTIFHSPLGANENNKEILAFKDKLKEVHNRTIHLIVSPKCFKKSLMMIRTKKANSIRDYYVDIEEICLEFNKFLLENNKKELEETKINLERKETEFKRFIINQSNKVIKLEKDEYVYGSTNHLNALSNITKFGKSKNVTSRLCNFNINALDENEFYHCLIKKVYDSSTLESLIHSLLKPFNYKNELFQLHSTPLLKIVNKICFEYNKLTDLVNDYIENEFQNDLNLEVKIPKPLTGDEIKNIKQDIEIEINANDEETDINIERMAIEDNIHIYKGIKLYNCPRCKIFTCKERNTMLNHISRSTKCKENKDTSEINIEELIKKNNIKFYPCEKCNKMTFSTPAKLRRHQYSLTPCTEVFRCEPCNLDFRIEVDLNAHKNRISCLGNHHEEETKEEKVNIQNEEKVNIINGMEFHKCNLCELLFKSKQNLNSHLNRKIKCNELHVCKLCNKKFHSIENLRKHEKNSTDCDKNIFKCGNCNKTFMSNKSLKKHTKLNNCIKDKY